MLVLRVVLTPSVLDCRRLGSSLRPEVRAAGGASATEGERCRTMVAFRYINVPACTCTLYIQWGTSVTGMRLCAVS